MSEDEKEPLSAVDVAYDFIDEADDDWTKDELLAVLARAGFLLDHEAELDDILEAVLECLEYEKILSEAIKCPCPAAGTKEPAKAVLPLVIALVAKTRA